MKQKLFIIIATCCLLLSTKAETFTSFAQDDYEPVTLYGSWQKDEIGWWFSNNYYPTRPADRWGEYRGNSYYFNADGYMVTGWQAIDGNWYCFNRQSGKAEGSMMIGWIYDDDYKGWFYTNQLGILVTGWHKIGEYWYYFNPNSDGTRGIMVSNKIVDNVYVDSNGRMNESK